MKILLSIRPEFVEQIFKGNKKFEYRKSIFRNKDVNSVVIYSTMPVGKIVGEFSLTEIIQDEPKNIWERTEKSSGISKTFFDEYFEGRNIGYALKIGKLKKYKKPIDPYVEYKEFTAPQSFKYLQEDLVL